MKEKIIKYIYGIIIALCSICLSWLGSYGTVNVLKNRSKYILLVSATIFIIIAMVLSWISMKLKSNKEMLYYFLMSIIIIIASYSVAYAMIYYIGLPENKIYFSYGTNEDALLFFDFVYYSVVTFTTLGFGDITPVSTLARIYTMSESLIFVIYISIIILNIMPSKLTNKR